MNDVMEKIKKELKEKIQDPVEEIKEQLEGKAPDLAEIKDAEGVEELQNETLDKVSGAGNPFEDIPRVPNNPIDPELREKA